MGNIGKYVLVTFAAVTAFIAIASVSVHAQERKTINAFSVWKATGQTFITGEKMGTLIGVLRGLLFIETEQGPQRAGAMVCPLTITINVETGEQEGTGKCIITAKDGPMLFADVACRGFHLVGCKGDFTLRGGTERFRGIIGGGPVTFRSDEWTITSLGKFETVREAVGIAYWQELNLELIKQ